MMKTNTYTPEELAVIIEEHRKWRFGLEGGKRADLQRADLQRADLQGAYLQYADLRGAYLQGADLQRAYLQGADLRGADLQRADLQGADLQCAKDLRLPTGESWTDYLEQTLPALLTAGGKSLESFENPWKCHDWANCPMAHAFDIYDLSKGPILLQPRIDQFIQLFDAHQLPWSVVQAAVEKQKKKNSDEI